MNLTKLVRENGVFGGIEGEMTLKKYKEGLTKLAERYDRGEISVSELQRRASDLLYLAKTELSKKEYGQLVRWIDGRIRNYEAS